MSRVAATLALELSRTMWCPNCDIVFSPQQQCPRCASTIFYPLAAWLDRVREPEGGQ